MIVELLKEYRFEAAHRLPAVPPGHKCARMHGHSYVITLGLQGPVDPQTGWLVDYAVMDDAWADLHARLDHRCLNDVPGLENSTCENLCRYVWDALKPRLPQLAVVTVAETAYSRCTYRGH